MKLVRFGERGAERPGLIDADGRVRDLSSVIADIEPSTLSPESLARLGTLDVSGLPVVVQDVRLGPCVGKIGKILCIGLNYRDHASETKQELPKEPLLFMKATSALNGPHDHVEIPRTGVQMDYEGELAVVIGRPARYVKEADALSFVAGYAIMDDVSERLFQKQRGGQMTKGKSGDTWAPLGPWLVTADEVPDPQKLLVRTEVDGEVRQNGTTADMVFPVAHLISYLSEFFTLYPGDIISTGTPEGVAAGMNPPGWVQPGQTVRISITGPDGLSLGEQRSLFVKDQ
ncbi:MAG: fumarylacetoacetate hydrolase family protein [Parvibaculaceae bacterium]|nr:fumarylacetoacetate hydrolase family protein [Parvibaculaceae bacterium]